MSESLLKLTATQALAALKKGETTSLELTQASLDRIASRNDKINAYITVTSDVALASAKQADADRTAGKSIGALSGLPIAVKDLYCTNGILTTAASHILNGFKPAYESTVTSKLWAAGAVNLGKLNMDEFAMGGSGENSFYGAAKNPWDESRVPGGSSSGSSAAVADYQCYAATGSDTGGSIRQPASFTGTVGVKPTYGRCSRWGMVAFASSLDQAGIFARNTEDAALLLQTISGHDPMDSTSAPKEVPDWTSLLTQGSLKGLKIGLPKEYFIEGLDPRIAKAVKDAATQFAAQGAEVVEVSLPHTAYAVAAYYIIAPAEAASNLARYDGMRYGLRVEGKNLNETYTNTRTEGFGNEVKRRIMVGNYVLSSGYYDAYYTKAQRIRTLIRQDFTEAFKQVDIIFAPTAPSLAFKIGEKSNDPVSMYLEDAFTIPASIAGLPGLSVPCGLADESGTSLPIGLQMIAPEFEETRLFQASHAWEQMRGSFATPFKI